MNTKDFTESLKDTILKVSPAASFVTITSIKELVPGKDTTKKSRATGLPLQYTIVKKSTKHGGCGNEYEQAVNNRLTKEGKQADFTKQERTWGDRVGNSPIITYKGKFYLEYNNTNYNWAKNKTEYFYLINGELVALTEGQTDDLKANFLPVKSNSNNQGTDKPIIINTIALDTLVEFHGFGFQMNRKIKL
jgi:hypothetical protein